MKRPLVSCIVLTHNSSKFITRCLTALTKVKYSNVEILLVDNKSTDSTLALSKKFSASIKIYARKKNDGYAGGHTFGIMKASGKYLFLLNPDTIVSPNFLQPLVSILEENHSAAAVQPLVYLLENPKLINLTGKVTQYLGFDWLRNFEQTQAPRSGEIISFSGSGVLLRKTAIEEVGGLDKNYFMYYEDTDLSWRLRMAGHSLRYCAESVVYHDYKLVPDEAYQPLKQKLFWAERNRLFTVFKNYSLSTLILLLPMLLIVEVALLVYFSLKGWLVVKLKSYSSLWQARKQIIISRQAIQSIRKLDDRQIANVFKTRIEFRLFDHPVIRYLLNPLLHIYWQLIWPLV